MTDRFDEAKRALEGVPAHDVWAEAERRATDGNVVPLAPVSRPPRRSRRWIAAAAVVALIAGTAAVLAGNNDNDLDTGPSTNEEPAAQEELTVYQADGGCKFGVRREPLPSPTTTAFGDVDSTGGTMVTGHLNDVQQYAVHVPGQAVIDLIGERVEDVQLQRGTAQIWFQVVPNDSVQVRWFTGSQEPCDSFTVSVESGTEDENRHAAVDLAERIVLPSELAEDPTDGWAPYLESPLAGTEWQLERATVGGEPTGGSGALFSFTEDQITWGDLCNNHRSTYEIAEGVLRVTDSSTTLIDCDYNPTTSAINSLMDAENIEWTIDDRGFLILSAVAVELTLRPPVDDVMETTTSIPPPGGDVLVGLWDIAYLGGAPLPDGELLVEFSDGVVSWTDGCTGHSGDVTYHVDENLFVVTNVAGDGVECPADPGRDVINGVFRASVVEWAGGGDEVRLVAGDHVISLERDQAQYVP